MTFDPARFDRAWARYAAAIEKGHAAFNTYFASSASETDIAETESKIGFALPFDLRHLLLQRNGSNEVQVLPGWELFSARRIVDEWSIWEELRRDQFVPEGNDCAPIGPIRGDEWWRLGWIPFCGDGGGNHLCVDMDPDKGGTPGQVLTMWHDDATRAFVTPSLTEFIELIADRAEKGELRWDEDWGGVYEPVEG